MGTAWAQATVEPVSRQIIGFSWWWVAAGVLFWVLVVALYYRTFLTDIEAKHVAERKAGRQQRRKQARVSEIQGGLAKAIRVARVEREAAEAAAALAEKSADAASARKAADQAAAAARRSEDSATAATANVIAMKERWVRKLMDPNGPFSADAAKADAVKAQEAARLAADAAVAKERRMA